MAPKETENNAYAYSSIMVCYDIFCSWSIHFSFLVILTGLNNASPGRGQKKRANAPSSVNTATFSLIAQSSSAILSILMRDFFVSINVFLCNSAILIKTSH